MSSDRLVHARDLSGAEKQRLFAVSVTALVSSGIAFAVRTGILSPLARDLFPGPGGEKVGQSVGFAFLGFAFSIVISSPLIDRLGMKTLLVLSSSLLLLGTLGVIFVEPLGAGLGLLDALCASFLVFGLGWGLIESAINPLISTIYSDENTKKLNHLHAWWPAGLVAGGLFGYWAGGRMPWRAEVAATLVPIALFGLAALFSRFPVTERTSAGIGDAEMFRELKRPLFIILFLCMFLTASSELAPNQWVDFALSHAVGMKGILLLVYVSAIMFVGRHFAGPLVHRLSPMGLLWFSVVLASIGLVLLGHAHDPATAMTAATVWGVGVCFLWPTMLATTSERFPRGGSLLLGLMGAAGMSAIFLVLPRLGDVYDRWATIDAHSAGYSTFDALKSAATASDAPVAVAARYDHAQAVAGSHSFLALAILPAILIVVFGAIWLSDRARGGYKVERLNALTDEGQGSGG